MSIFHFTDSSLYNLVLNNTVIIVYKLINLVISLNPLLLNVQFRYETSYARGKTTGLNAFVFRKANGVLAMLWR